MEKREEGAERYTFGVHHLHLLEATRATLEGLFHYTCRTETETFHGFELHTLIAIPPKGPTRAEIAERFGVLAINKH